MTLQSRDKRALALLGAAVVLMLAYWASGSRENTGAKTAALDSIPAAEKRLVRVRELAASLPAKQDALKQVWAELAAREGGLIEADTAAQAQAVLLQIVKRVGKAQSPPLE